MQGLDKLTDRDLDKLHSKEYNEQFRTWLRNPNALHATQLIAAGPTGEAVRAMGTASGAAGGFMASESFSEQVWKRMTQTSPMRSVATIGQVIGTAWAVPFLDDSSNSDRLLAEGELATETDLTVGLRKLPSFTFSSDTIRASIQLAQDSGPALEEFLIDALSERLARNLNRYATVGAGANEPQGLSTACLVGKVGAAGQTATVTFGDLEDVVGSVSESYVWGRDGLTPSAKWMMNGGTFTAIRKLSDGDGRPIWIPDASGRSVGSLLGFPVCVNSDMPSMGASAKAILFGDFRCYAIRDGAVLVQVLRERYIDRAQFGYSVFSRHAAGLIDEAGVRAYQNAAS